MKKKRKNIIMIIIAIVVILSIVVIEFFVRKAIEENNEKRQHKDPYQCVERMLKIELGEGVILVEGKAYDEIYKGERWEEHVQAKFKVEKDEVGGLKEKLEKCLGLREDDLEIIQYMEGIKHMQMDLADKTIVSFYDGTREGKHVKTISIEAFIVTDDTGEYYFYIFY